MKIFVISTHDSRGGAANSAYRFSKEFEQQGHEVFCTFVIEKKQRSL